MDMNQLWEYLDAEVAATPMPKEYENYIVDILCKDCHKVGGDLDGQTVQTRCKHKGWLFLRVKKTDMASRLGLVSNTTG